MFAIPLYSRPSRFDLDSRKLFCLALLQQYTVFTDICHSGRTAGKSSHLLTAKLLLNASKNSSEGITIKLMTAIILKKLMSKKKQKKKTNFR